MCWMVCLLPGNCGPGVFSERHATATAPTARRGAELWSESEQQRDEFQELRFRQEQVREAAEAGEKILFDSSNVGPSLAESCAATMYRRMGIADPPTWMRWNHAGNWAVFAIRSWAALVYRSLGEGICELVSCGSCELAVGAEVAGRMYEMAARQGFKYILLKALAGSDNFWTQEGFLPLTNRIGWLSSCDMKIKRIRRQYAKEATPLVPFAKKVPDIEAALQQV